MKRPTLRSRVIFVACLVVCAIGFQLIEESYLPDWALLPATSLLVVPPCLGLGGLIGWPKTGGAVGVAAWLACIAYYRVQLGPF